MEQHLEVYIPSDDELLEIDKIIEENPELQEIVADNNSRLCDVLNAIDNFNLPASYKKTIKSFFNHLGIQQNEKLIYKYTAFRNQELIDNFIEREREFKKIIKEQDDKIGTTEGMDNVDKMFSTMVVTTKYDKPLTGYMNKKIGEIKNYDHYHDLFSKPGATTVSVKALKEQKGSNKGTNFKNVKDLTIINEHSSNPGHKVIHAKSNKNK